MLLSVASKGLERRRLRLKTGKTLCLSATAHSKGLRPIRDVYRASERRRGSGPPPTLLCKRLVRQGLEGGGRHKADAERTQRRRAKAVGQKMERHHAENDTRSGSSG